MNTPQPKAAREGYVVTARALLERAVHNGLITPEEARSHKFMRAAQDVADALVEHWPEGEGFGSSDMTYAIEEMLQYAGVPHEYKNNRLVRKEASMHLAQRIISKYLAAAEPEVPGVEAPVSDELGAPPFGEAMVQAGIDEIMASAQKARAAHTAGNKKRMFFSLLGVLDGLGQVGKAYDLPEMGYLMRVWKIFAKMSGSRPTTNFASEEPSSPNPRG
jgi:hypothetical protein